MHKNNDRINNLWKGLEYFSYANFAKRLAIANQMLVQHKTTDEVFSKNFYSAEGWYSQVIFSINSESIHSNKLSDEVSIKLIGRGFNDFSPAPLVLLNGRLSGCDSQDTLTGCIAHIKQEKDNTTVYTIPKIHVSYFSVAHTYLYR